MLTAKEALKKTLEAQKAKEEQAAERVRVWMAAAEQAIEKAVRSGETSTTVTAPSAPSDTTCALRTLRGAGFAVSTRDVAYYSGPETEVLISWKDA